jgi:hypothetical protein
MYTLEYISTICVYRYEMNAKNIVKTRDDLKHIGPKIQNYDRVIGAKSNDK